MLSCVKKLQFNCLSDGPIVMTNGKLTGAARKHIAFSRLIADVVNQKRCTNFAKMVLWTWIFCCLPFFDTFALTQLS